MTMYTKESAVIGVKPRALYTLGKWARWGPIIQPRLVLNLEAPCLSFPSAGIAGLYSHLARRPFPHIYLFCASMHVYVYMPVGCVCVHVCMHECACVCVQAHTCGEQSTADSPNHVDFEEQIQVARLSSRHFLLLGYLSNWKIGSHSFEMILKMSL